MPFQQRVPASRKLARGFRVPGAVGALPLPLLPVLGIVMALGLMTQFEPRVYAVAALAVAVGLALRWLAQREQRRQSPV